MIETECQECGSSVTPQFVRVFAEDETEGVHAYPSCTGEAAIVSGACRPGGRRSAGGGPVTTPTTPMPEATSEDDVATDGGGERHE